MVEEYEKINEFDKEQLTKIEEKIADMADIHMISGEAFIFDNETLNVFFSELINMIGIMKEKENILDYVDAYNNMILKVKVIKKEKF